MAPSSSTDSPPPTPGAPSMRPIPLPEEDTFIIPPEINRLLSASQDHVLYDFSVPIRRGVDTNHPLHELLDSEPATDPPLNKLYIYCPLARTTIPIEVEPDDFVSVLKVLDSIHTFFHRQADRRSLSVSGNTSADVEAQFARRCQAISDEETRLFEVAQGMKKVDLLRGRHHFGGLLRTENVTDVVELRLEEGR